jgi:hypothetical protein
MITIIYFILCLCQVVFQLGSYPRTSLTHEAYFRHLNGHQNCAYVVLETRLIVRNVGNDLL